MQLLRTSRTPAALTLVAGAMVSLLAACGSDSTAPANTAGVLQFTSAQIGALDSTSRIVLQANPGNPDIESLVDSTLLVLSAGVQAKQVGVSTDLTTAPLYFVGVHRVFNSPASSSSTWTLVGIDDPAHLTNLIEVSGFAQTAGPAAPSSATGTIGQTGNIGNGVLLQIGTSGAVTEWRPNSGSASFLSDAPGSACPSFAATAHVTCALETMHVHFTVAAATGTGGAGSRQAAVGTDVDVPAMRLTYAP